MLCVCDVCVCDMCCMCVICMSVLGAVCVCYVPMSVFAMKQMCDGISECVYVYTRFPQLLTLSATIKYTSATKSVIVGISIWLIVQLASISVN